MLNTINSGQIDDRVYKIKSIRPYDEHFLKITGSKYSADINETMGAINNLMLEKMLANQEKIMRKLDIEA